ncbi:acyl dehydratase [Brevundimonas sp. R86498]|uniref:acyl dehydratase n=1 Tax=Brevundimonas sp. R86498 TaxID=3093845 RepID=UPI0037C95B49
MSDPLHVHFEDLEIGQVLQLGACAVDEAAITVFVDHFAPGWDLAYGAPDALVYALWSRLHSDKAAGWAQTKLLAVDGLRYMRNPPAGELLRGRMTVMGKDPVGDEKGIVIAQHDLLDEGGRLVFSCLTRGLFVRR